MSHHAFDASRVRVDLVEGALLVTFGQDSEGERPYLTLRRERRVAAARADYSVEINDQAQCCVEGIERAILGTDFLRLQFSAAAASRLGGTTSCKVQFPPLGPRHPLSRHRGPHAGQLHELPDAVRLLFADTAVELAYALPRPQVGANRCRLDVREQRELGWHPSLGPGWDSVMHCAKCDHMVFLAEDDSDAQALGSLGQCVKLTQGCRGTVLFIGQMEGGSLERDDRVVMPAVALPEEATGHRAKAVEGFRLYMNRFRNFEDALAMLRDGREVTLPMMKFDRAQALQRRLQEWHLVVQLVEYLPAAAD